MIQNNRHKPNTLPMRIMQTPDSSLKKRHLAHTNQEAMACKKARLAEADHVQVKHADVLICQSESRVTIFSDWMKQRQMNVAAKFVAEVEADGGQFILLLPNNRMEVLTEETEKVRWVIEARKQQRRHPASKPTSTYAFQNFLEDSDILMIQSADKKVTLYSDWMKQRADVVAAQFVAQVRSEGGNFVLREDGMYRYVRDEVEMIKWVIQARKEIGSEKSPPRSLIMSSPYREVRNLAIDEDEPDIVALDMRNGKLKASAPLDDNSNGRYGNRFGGGTPFQPVLKEAEIRTFILKANKMKQRSDDALYKLLDELEDEEDAVHLYRNFHDDPKYCFGTTRTASNNSKIALSRREVDILAASILYGIDQEYTWNLMPYRNQKALYKLYSGSHEQLKVMLKDQTYVQHLNQHVSHLFEEEIHE